MDTRHGHTNYKLHWYSAWNGVLCKLNCLISFKDVHLGHHKCQKYYIIILMQWASKLEHKKCAPSALPERSFLFTIPKHVKKSLKKIFCLILFYSYSYSKNELNLSLFDLLYYYIHETFAKRRSPWTFLNGDTEGPLKKTYLSTPKRPHRAKFCKSTCCFGEVNVNLKNANRTKEVLTFCLFINKKVSSLQAVDTRTVSERAQDWLKISASSEILPHALPPLSLSPFKESRGCQFSRILSSSHIIASSSTPRLLNQSGKLKKGFIFVGMWFHEQHTSAHPGGVWEFLNW